MNKIDQIDTMTNIKLSSDLFLCTGEDNKNIYLVDPKTLALLETYSADSNVGRRKLIVSERFGHIIAEQSDKTILIYFNLSNNKPASRTSLPEKVASLCFSHDEYFCYGGGQSGLLYVWDCMTGHLLHKFQAHHKALNKILVSNDGGTIITSGEDYAINIWNAGQIFCRNSQWNMELNSVRIGEIAKVKPKHSLIGHTNHITDMAISDKSNGILASCSIDKTCRIWDYSKVIFKDPFEDLIYLGCKNKNIYAHKLTENKDIYQIAIQDTKQNPKLQIEKKNVNKKVFAGHKDEVLLIQYYLEENVVVSGGGDGQILFWNSEGSIVKQLNILNKAVSNLYFFKRTREFEKNDSFLKNKKKGIEPKLFKKFEEEKIQTDPITLPLAPLTNSQQSKRKREIDENDPIVMKYLQLSLAFVEGGAGSSISQNGRSSGQDKEIIEDLKNENEKLLKMNEKLFSLCFMKDKI